MTELALTKILPPAPVPCVLVKIPLGLKFSSIPLMSTESARPLRPCTVMLPAAPAPVEAAVIVPPVLRVTVSAFTVIEPPVAVGTVPDVDADSVPPFCSVNV